MTFLPSYVSTLPFSFCLKNFRVSLSADTVSDEFSPFLFVSKRISLNFRRYKILDGHFEDILLPSGFHFFYQGLLHAFEFNVYFFFGCFGMFSHQFYYELPKCGFLYIFFPLWFKVLVETVTCIYSRFWKILGYYLLTYC